MPRRSYPGPIPTVAERWPTPAELVAHAVVALQLRADLPVADQRVVDRVRGGARARRRTVERVLWSSISHLVPPTALADLLGLDEGSRESVVALEATMLKGRSLPDGWREPETWRRLTGVLSTWQGYFELERTLGAGVEGRQMLEAVLATDVVAQATTVRGRAPRPSRRLALAMTRTQLLIVALRHVIGEELVRARRSIPPALWWRGVDGQRQYMAGLLREFGLRRRDLDDALAEYGETAADKSKGGRTTGSTVTGWLTRGARPQRDHLENVLAATLGRGCDRRRRALLRLRLRFFFALQDVARSIESMFGGRHNAAFRRAYEKQVVRLRALLAAADLGTDPRYGRTRLLAEALMYHGVGTDLAVVVDAMGARLSAASWVDLRTAVHPVMTLGMLAPFVEGASERALSGTSDSGEPLGLSGPLGLDAMVRE
jgi:hypothetical protein